MSMMKKVMTTLCVVAGFVVITLCNQSSKTIENFDEQGRTELYKFIESDDFQAVVAGIQAGNNVNHKDNDNITPLQVVAMKTKLKKGGEIAQALINAGADITMKDAQGNSLLDLAVEKRTVDVVNVLIQSGVDINMQNKVDGSTPLHKAICNAAITAIKDYQKMFTCPCCADKNIAKNIAMAQALINAGADQTIKNKHGHTALEIINELERNLLWVDNAAHVRDCALHLNNIYYDLDWFVYEADDFAIKIAVKFQALKDLFIA